MFTTSSAIGNRSTVANTARASHTVDTEAEQLRDAGERGGEVDRAEDDHAGRHDERLDEHRDRFFARLAVLAVVTGRAEPGFELAERVAAHDPIEVGIAERPDGSAPGRTSSFAPTPTPSTTVTSATGSDASIAASSVP